MSKSFFFFLGCSVFLVGCSSSNNSANVTTSLQRLGTPSSLSTLSKIALEGDASSDIVIEALEVPILGVVLSSSVTSEGAEIYRCDVTATEDCLVNLADGTALQNLLNGAAASEIKAGKYDSVEISNCKSEGTYTGYIQATGNLDGTIYRTKSNSSVIVADAAPAEKQAVTFSGCSNSYPIPNGVTLEEGQDVTMNLFFDLTHIAFFSKADALNMCSAGGNSVVDNGCGTTTPVTPAGPFVSVNYLDVAGTVDNSDPKLELYFLELTAIGNTLVQRGVVGVIRDSADHYIGGYTRSSWAVGQTTQGSSGLVTPIRTFNEVGGSYVLENYGSSSTSSAYKITIDFVAGIPATCSVVDMIDSEDMTCDFFIP